MADGRNIENPGRPGGRASSEARDEIDNTGSAGVRSTPDQGVRSLIDNTGSAGVRSTPDQGVRSSIDALFVGSLYGELTPAEKARLSAHLEAHPTDQQTLDGLQSARMLVRESRIADHQLDPPQGISALLLQEAARRAPKRDAEQSWFARLLSVVVAHPALASVASLVLVVGVGSTLYMRNGAMPLAERTAGQSHMAASEAVDTSPPAPAPEAVAAAEPKGNQAADAEAVRVGLDDEGAGLEHRERAMGAGAKNPAKAKRPAELKPTPANAATSEFARGKSDELGKLLPRDDAQAAKKATKDVSSKSFDSRGEGADKAEALGTSSGAQKEYAQPATVAGANDAERDEAPSGRFAVPPPSAAQTGRASATQSVPTKPSVAQAPIAQAPRPKASVVQAPIAQAPRTKASVAQAPVAQAPTGKTAAGQGPAAQAPSAEFSVAEQSYGGGASAAKNQGQSSAWARDLHRRVLGLVKTGKCDDATPLLAQLKNRDPDYYRATVATDRTLGPCLARIAEAAQRNSQPRKSDPAKAGLAQ